MRALLLCAKTLLLGSLSTVALGCAKQPAVAEPPPVEVIVSQPVSDKIADWEVYTGTVEAKEKVDISSRVRGHIKDVLFTEGEEIAAGTELFVIDSAPFHANLEAAQEALKNWEAKLKLAEETIAIRQPLAEKGTVSKEEIFKALADKGEALGGIGTAKGNIMEAELNIGYSKITAPIAGKVGQAIVTKGNLVNASGADSLLTRIVAVDPMYVEFHVNERALLNYQKQLREGKSTNSAEGDKRPLPVELALLGDAGFPFKGEIDFVDNRVDPATGAIKVRARFNNPKVPGGGRALTSGLFARIRVTVGEPHATLLLADRAILSDQSLKYVLVVNKEKKNVVERVDVTVSSRVQESGLRAVEAGLKGGEWVIVEGVNRARPGVTVQPTEGKMPQRPTAGK